MAYLSWEKDGIMQYQTVTIGKNVGGFQNQVVFSLQWEELELFIGSLVQLKMRGLKYGIVFRGSTDRDSLKVTITLALKDMVQLLNQLGSLVLLP